jgi:hypothetical protein
MRGFKTTDLRWLKPLALEYGEWDGLCAMLAAAMETTGYSSVWVIEPKTIVAMWNDGHGICLAGLAGKPGLKAMIRLGRHCIALADKAGVDLHSHATDAATWQHKLMTATYGFKPAGAVLARPAGGN